MLSQSAALFVLTFFLAALATPPRASAHDVADDGAASSQADTAACRKGAAEESRCDEAACAQMRADQTAAAVLVAPDGGRPLSVVGDTIVVKLAPTPGGPGAVIEEITPPNGGPPPHEHRDDDELMYVSEGRFEVRVGDSTAIAEKGAFAFLPHGVPHSFRNLDDKPSRAFVLITPGQVVGFFERVDALAAADATPATLSRIAGDYGLRILPPRPAPHAGSLRPHRP